MADSTLTALGAATSPLAAADVLYVVQGGTSKKATVADLPANARLQFRDEGSDLGAAGTVGTLDFTGAGVSAARVGNTVTVNIAGGGGATPTGTGFRHVTAGVEDAASATIPGAFVIVLDGGGETLLVGPQGYFTVHRACTITGWRIKESSPTPISASIVIDVWKDIDANYPPTVADTIAGTEKPTLTAAIKNDDFTLTTWTPALAAGDVIGINIDSVTAAKRIELVLLTSYAG